MPWYVLTGLLISAGLIGSMVGFTIGLNRGYRLLQREETAGQRCRKKVSEG